MNADPNHTTSLDALIELLGDDVLGQFHPGAFYQESMDWLIILTEDVGYVAESIQHGDIEILWHPAEPRIVGIKLWDISKRPGGSNVLQKAHLHPAKERQP